MIEKDFDKWNHLKKKLHLRPEILSFREGEIWWCSLGLNLGSEQDGKNELFERPALVLKRFNGRVALVAPLTTKIKHDSYHVQLGPGFVILSQIRLVSVKRFQRFARVITDSDLMMIRRRVSDLMNQP